MSDDKDKIDHGRRETTGAADVDQPQPRVWLEVFPKKTRAGRPVERRFTRVDGHRVMVETPTMRDGSRGKPEVTFLPSGSAPDALETFEIGLRRRQEQAARGSGNRGVGRSKYPDYLLHELDARVELILGKRPAASRDQLAQSLLEWWKGEVTKLLALRPDSSGRAAKPPNLESLARMIDRRLKNQGQ